MLQITQIDVVAQVLNSLRIALFQIQGECLLGNVVAAEDGLDFLERLGVEVLEIAHFGEGVSD